RKLGWRVPEDTGPGRLSSNPGSTRNGKSTDAAALPGYGGALMASLAITLVLIVAWAYVAASSLAALRFARRGPGVRGVAPVRQLGDRLPVSVLKPLHGDE